jgi:hypothetical protein
MGFEINNKIGRGRKVGSFNKATISIKDNFQSLIENNLELLDADLKSLSSKDRLRTIIDLAKFVVPTLKQVEQDIKNTTDLTWLETWSEEDLTKLLNN